MVLFGGSGAECEVCKEGKRNYISAELHDEYYKMILERLKAGKIPEKYWHESRKIKRNPSEPNSLDNLTVPQLRDKLREKGLKIAGMRSELIARLEEHA